MMKVVLALAILGVVVCGVVWNAVYRKPRQLLRDARKEVRDLTERVGKYRHDRRAPEELKKAKARLSALERRHPSAARSVQESVRRR